MRRLALLLLLAGCGRGAEERNDRPTDGGDEAPPAPLQPPPSAEQLAASRAAADALSLYYEHIGRRDYRAAWTLREQRPGLSFAAFAASFDRYRDYRATVGVPSLPAEQDGTLWVDVPVQLYGRMRDGSPFGSVGRVTMKRPAGEQAWKVAP